MHRSAKAAFWLLFYLSAHFLPDGVAAQSQNQDGWRLVQIPRPPTGAILPALLEVADLDRSDPGLIGMMVRCSEKPGENDLVPVFIIAEPLSPLATPQVTLQASGPDVVLEGHVIPTGAGIWLPLDIRAQILGPWRNSPELHVAIKNEATTIRGVIRLTGLFEGLNQLGANCQNN